MCESRKKKRGELQRAQVSALLSLCNAGMHNDMQSWPFFTHTQKMGDLKTKL